MRKELSIDIPIVMENDLMCHESIIDVSLAMEPAWWPECCIYRAPKKLREVNKEAYTPKLISIGPFHYGGKEPRDKDGEREQREMEKLKVGYLKKFCNRTRKSQKEIARIIEENEEKIRRCYSESFDICHEDFVKMVLLDSTFIIELFLRSYMEEEYENDYILSKPWLKIGVSHDLILLENQLPFFILKELHNQFSRSEENNNISFRRLACKFFHLTGKKLLEKEIKHFTDLIRYFYYPSTLKSGNGIIFDLHSATELYEAGVIFRTSEKGRMLLDIQFPNMPLKRCPCFNCSWLLNCLPCLKCFPCLEGTQTFLYVPQFLVQDKTEGLLRNLMALEQCHYPSEAYICNYICLLDYLINTREDVELLVDKKIIINMLGSNEAIATMVNKLGLEIVETCSCYFGLAQELNKHYDECCNRNMGNLRSSYFSNLWRGTATIIGLIVLGFTLWNFIRPYVYVRH
ncbi:putative UPF0481 protein At3g02645 [Quercus lobata]|uniref:Uncharacterized protein n=1 Tax=Quercus lobata TaxID=97700 RepID=A0A7N2LG66_QUELO|nr:putative UPF0481 protein At3g02645 [Quercus lobata]